MYRPSSTQGDLLTESAWVLGERKVAALKGSWAGVFRAECLPMLDESPFAKLYQAKHGRPCAPIRVLVGVMVLQTWWNLSDQQALDCLSYDARWQCALGLSMHELAPCRRTLVQFRKLVMKDNQLSTLFQAQVDKMQDKFAQAHVLQRMDSSEVMACARALSRLQSLVVLVQTTLRAVTRHAPEWLPAVPAALITRYRTPQGEDISFGDVSGTRGRRRMAVVARDLGRLLTALQACAGTSPVPAKLEAPLALLRRMVGEQCDVLDTPETGTGDDEDAGEAPVCYRLRPKETLPTNAVQTPHDPDLRRSGKSGKVVHKAVITETCAPPVAPDAPADAIPVPSIITDIRVEEGHASDQGCAEAVLETLAAHGRAPETLLADTAFCGQTHVDACAAQGTELVGPVGGHTPDGTTPSLAGWRRDADRTLRCPAGHAPVEDTGREADWPLQKRWRARYDPATCAACPQAATCAAQPMKTKPWWKVVGDDLALLSAQRRAVADTEAMRRLYARRAGCEATVFELKHLGGMGRLRVRGRPRVAWWCQLIAYATNFRRLVRYRLRCARAAAAAAA